MTFSHDAGVTGFLGQSSVSTFFTSEFELFSAKAANEELSLKQQTKWTHHPHQHFTQTQARQALRTQLHADRIGVENVTRIGRPASLVTAASCAQETIRSSCLDLSTCNENVFVCCFGSSSMFQGIGVSVQACSDDWAFFYLLKRARVEIWTSGYRVLCFPRSGLCENELVCDDSSLQTQIVFSVNAMSFNVGLSRIPSSEGAGLQNTGNTARFAQLFRRAILDVHTETSFGAGNTFRQW